MDKIPDELQQQFIFYLEIKDKIILRTLSTKYSKIINKNEVFKYLILKIYRLGFEDGFCSNIIRGTINTDISKQQINTISDSIIYFCNNDFGKKYSN